MLCLKCSQWPERSHKRAIEDLRAAHFLIAVVAIDAAHVLLDLLPHGPAVRMPEHHAGRFFLQVEQIELPAELAMVALLGFFQHVQVGVEFFLLRPGGAVDALQLLVLLSRRASRRRPPSSA
jgi:hypothetical protein